MSLHCHSLSAQTPRTLMHYSLLVTNWKESLKIGLLHLQPFPNSPFHIPVSWNLWPLNRCLHHVAQCASAILSETLWCPSLRRHALQSAGGPFLLHVTSLCACVRACVSSCAVLNSRQAYSSLLGVILSIGVAFCQRILNTRVGLLPLRDFWFKVTTF